MLSYLPDITSTYSTKAIAIKARLQLLKSTPKLLWTNEEREFAASVVYKLSSLKTKKNKQNKDNDNNKEDENSLGYRYYILQIVACYNAIVSLFIATETDDDEDDNVNNSNEAMTVLGMLDFQSFVSTMLSNMVVLMTFGVMSPLVAIAVATSIYIPSLYLQMIVGRRCISLQQNHDINNNNSNNTINYNNNNNNDNNNDDDKLLPNWKAVIDSTSGRTYYWNIITNETTWKLPSNNNNNTNSNSNSISVMSILEKDCDGNLFERSIYQMRYLFVFLSSLFMAAFLIDTAGDDLGWKRALGNTNTNMNMNIY